MKFHRRALAVADKAVLLASSIPFAFFFAVGLRHRVGLIHQFEQPRCNRADNTQTSREVAPMLEKQALLVHLYS